MSCIFIAVIIIICWINKASGGEVWDFFVFKNEKKDFF